MKLHMTGLQDYREIGKRYVQLMKLHMTGL